MFGEHPVILRFRRGHRGVERWQPGERTLAQPGVSVLGDAAPDWDDDARGSPNEKCGVGAGRLKRGSADAGPVWRWRLVGSEPCGGAPRSHSAHDE